MNTLKDTPGTYPFTILMCIKTFTYTLSTAINIMKGCNSKLKDTLV